VFKQTVVRQFNINDPISLLIPLKHRLFHFLPVLPNEKKVPGLQDHKVAMVAVTDLDLNSQSSASFSEAGGHDPNPHQREIPDSDPHQNEKTDLMHRSEKAGVQKLTLEPWRLTL
jgi:hypothetical protein